MQQIYLMSHGDKSAFPIPIDIQRIHKKLCCTNVCLYVLFLCHCVVVLVKRKVQKSLNGNFYVCETIPSSFTHST